jgi:hypothetical protein
MSHTPRLTADDVAALRSLASGPGTIAPVSCYWLSLYELIDETPRGWRLTARGEDFLRAPLLEERDEAPAPSEPRALAAEAAADARRPRRRRRTMALARQ